MISEQMVSWLDSNFGKNRYAQKLRDFTDGQLRTVIQESKPSSWDDLKNRLIQDLPDDSNIKAHILGFENTAARRSLLADIKKLQEQCLDPA